jgi:hypothetical protein
MTKQEYNWYHSEMTDALGHTIKVGDLVIFHWWDRRVKVGKVTRICKETIKILPLEYENSPWDILRSPKRVIKIKDDGIPES